MWHWTQVLTDKVLFSVDNHFGASETLASAANKWYEQLFSERRRKIEFYISRKNAVCLFVNAISQTLRGAKFLLAFPSCSSQHLVLSVAPFLELPALVSVK